MPAQRATLTLTNLTTYELAPSRDTAQVASLLAGGCGCPDEGSHPLSPQGFALANPDAPPGAVTWHGVIGFEGELTGDGRFIEPNALRWENLPIPLRHAASDVGGHDGAKVVARILTIERKGGGAIHATGDFDTASPEGREAARQVGDGFTRGISMDLDSVSFEVRIAKELLDASGGGLLGMLAEGEDSEAPEDLPTDDEGRVTVAKIAADDEVMVTTDARIRAATLVAIPAFAGAMIDLDFPAPAVEPVDGQPEAASAVILPFVKVAKDVPEDAVCAHEGCKAAPTHTADTAEEGVTVLYCEVHANEHDGQPLVAGAAPLAPPGSWFSRPDFEEVTPLVVTAEGRVYGHLATWGTCHTAYPGECVEPPRSPSGYAYFRRGAVLTAEGSEVATGTLTLDTLHAGRAMSPAATMAHYEHTGRGVADVVAGEDAFGIWVVGALRPNVTAEQVRALRASPLSGDWRRIGGNLELVGALACNIPGFPIPRPQGLVASGVMTSLVASGMLAPTKVVPPGAPGALSADDLRYLKRLVARERRAEAEVALGVQSAADALAMRVRATRVAAMARRLGTMRTTN